MGLNKQTGNMYDFVDFTWNPIKGKCENDCVYCYMKKWGKQKPIRIVEKEFSEFIADMKKYGDKQKIFVGSSCDILANNIPSKWIKIVLEFCGAFNNTYLIQSRNPERILDFSFPHKIIIGTTIESNRDYPEISKAPKIKERIKAMIKLKEMGFNTMVTIEPVLDFDVDELVPMIKIMEPKWVNLGADSGGHKLPEPSKEKLLELMSRVDIRQKKNLKRLLK